MPNRYKTLTIRLADEDQTYVVEDAVTSQQLLQGNDDGVVCHMVDSSKSELVSRLLNEYGGNGHP